MGNLTRNQSGLRGLLGSLDTTGNSNNRKYFGELVTSFTEMQI